MRGRILRVPFTALPHVIDGGSEIEELLQGMRRRYESAAGKDLAVEHLFYAVCNMRDMLKQEVGTEIRQGKGKENEGEA